MSRELLLEFANELDRLLTAGARSAVGSDALRRRAKVVEDLSAKVPALVPLKESIDRVLTASTKDAPLALLDLLTRARQLRAGLGDASTPGEVGELTSREVCATPLSTKRAHELHDTFLGSGGKQHALEVAMKEKEIGDLRLQRVLVNGLEDKDAGFAEEVSAKALPMLGKAVLPELLAGLDIPEGDTGDARRLQAICRIDAEMGLDLCRKALKEGSIKMVVQALELLPEVTTPAESEAAGLEYSRDKRATVRAAALQALRTSKKDEALDILIEKTDDKSVEVCQTAFAVLGNAKHSKSVERMMALTTEILGNLTVVPKVEPKKKPAKGATPAKKPAKKPAPPAAAKMTAEEIAALATKRNEEVQRAQQFLVALAQRKDIKKAEVAEFAIPLMKSKEGNVAELARTVVLRVGTALPDVVATFTDILDGATGWHLSEVADAMEKLEPAHRTALIPHLMKRTKKGHMPYGVVQSLFKMLREHAETDETFYHEAIRQELNGDDHWQWAMAMTEILKMPTEKSSKLLPEALDGWIKFSTGTSYYAPAHEDLVKLVRRDDPKATVTLARIEKALQTTKKVEGKQTLLQFLGSLGKLAAPAKSTIEGLTKDRNKEVKAVAEAVLRKLAE